MTTIRLTLCFALLCGCAEQTGKNNSAPTNNAASNNATVGSNNAATTGSNNASTNNASTNNVSTNNETNSNNSTNNVTTTNNATNNGTTNNGTGPIVVATDYDQSCLYNMDCELVLEGDVCDCPGCPTGSVAASVADQYNMDYADLADMCPPRGFMCPDVLCSAINPICSAGTCATQEPVFVVANDFNRQCGTADDCRAIYEGDVCAPCQCNNAAVTASEIPAVAALRVGVDCGNIPPVLCLDCPRLGVECNAGLCEWVPQ